MEFIAVDHPLLTGYIGALKQQALLFSRIAVPFLRTALSTYTRLESKHLSNSLAAAFHSDVTRNLEWLIEAGILFELVVEPTLRAESAERQGVIERLGHNVTEFIENLYGFKKEELEQGHASKTRIAEIQERLQIASLDSDLRAAVYNDPKKLIKPTLKAITTLTRLATIQLREEKHLDAHTFLPDDCFSFEPNRQATKHDVVKITLAAFPIPDWETSWEQIIDYRNDPASQDKFLDLRNWMSEVARGELTAPEIEEKLEYLLSRYRRQMDIHKMKANTSTFETIVVTSAEVLGNLASFQWGKAAKGLFSLKRRQVELLQGELTAEGSEVAYIVKTRANFA